MSKNFRKFTRIFKIIISFILLVCFVYFILAYFLIIFMVLAGSCSVSALKLLLKRRGISSSGLFERPELVSKTY